MGGGETFRLLRIPRLSPLPRFKLSNSFLPKHLLATLASIIPFDLNELLRFLNQLTQMDLDMDRIVRVQKNLRDVLRFLVRWFINFSNVLLRQLGLLREVVEA
ncbi:uncharacterized protein LOC131144443 [Malania oleifera]|uniref:uncharacterized protein LOC131144443 n=1 Tax=Malania oleifera TaxID=397392 RepID=UPI0025AE25F0|nr:uncharacterized protein LOC131144443 [Malania oleifera]